MNQQYDILPDHHIEYVIRSPFPEKYTSVISATVDLIKNKVSSVVGSLDNFGTEASNKFLNDFALVQSHSMAMSSDFGVGKSYPYKIQTVPVDSFEGTVV